MKPLLAGLFALKLAVVLWGVNRGFDLGDEGFFLLNLNHPREAPPLFAFYGLLTWFDPPLRFDVIGGRLLRIATELVATVFLATSGHRWARRTLPAAAAAGLPFLLGVVGLGTFLSVAARGFGYNDLTNLCMFVASGCVLRLLALAPPADAPRRALLLGAGVGIAVAFQLFVKFPAALLFAGLALPLVLLRPGLPPGVRGPALAGAAAGAAAVAGLFVATSGGVAPLLARWELAEEVNALTGYAIADILRVYVDYDWGSHWNLYRFTVAFAAVASAGYFVLRRRPAALDEALALALAVGAGVLTHGVFDFHAENVHPWLLHLYASSLLVGLLSLALLAAFWDGPARGTADSRRERSAALLPLLLLLALPFVEIAGTNVPITLRLPSHAAPVFLLLGIVLPALRARGFPRLTAVSLLLFAALTSVLFVEQHVRRPYGLPAPLHRQLHPVEGLPGLRVDRGTKAFLERLREMLLRAGYRPGDPVIALDFMPGLVHYVDGRSPGFPFYSFRSPEQNCWAINRSAGGPRPWLLLGQDMTLAQHGCIRAFDFPREFAPLDVLSNPYGEHAIPYFFGGPPMPWLQVFGPAGRARSAAR